MVAAVRERPAIRCLQAELVGLDGARVGAVGVVIAADDVPEIIMFDGEPYLHDASIAGEVWRRVRPYRCSSGG